MTVKQLKEKLSAFPDEMEVFMATPDGEFAYGLVNSVYQKEITFSEDPDTVEYSESEDEDVLYATERVVVIDEQ